MSGLPRRLDGPICSSPVMLVLPRNRVSSIARARLSMIDDDAP